MIDLHTHTLLSDGELLPSELVRRAIVKGYTAIALTDHVDSSNIDFVLPRLVKVSKILNKDWKIFVIPGVEVTHAPIEEIPVLVKFARRNGAKIVIVHGETPAEPVIKGTNRVAIESRCDILAHPGMITAEDAALAYNNKVCLEITARKLHRETNKHVIDMARKSGAKVVLNTDSHSPDDLISDDEAKRLLVELELSDSESKDLFANSDNIVTRIKTRC